VNFAITEFWEVRREPVLPLPGGGWHGILAPSHLTTGDNAQAGSVENERGRERMSEGSGRAEMERRLIEKSLEDESFRQRLIEDPKGGRGAGARDAAARRGAGGGRGGDPGHHLPGASQHPDGRR
jgi:hypothetical protein